MAVGLFGRHKWRALALAFLAVLYALIESHAVVASGTAESGGGGKAFILSDPEIRRLVPLALDGDGDAASSLSSHYQGLRQDESEMFWVRIAAENGHRISMGILGGSLFRSKGPINCRRARFWQKREIELSSLRSDTRQNALRALELEFDECMQRK